MIKQVYLNKELTQPIGDWFSDLYITGFMLEKCNISDRKFTFAILTPDISSTALAISLGLIWNNIFKNLKSLKQDTETPPFDKFLNSLSPNDEVYYNEDFLRKNIDSISKGKKGLKKRIFYVSKNEVEIPGDSTPKHSLYKFRLEDGKKSPVYISWDYKMVEKKIAPRKVSDVSIFIENFFIDRQLHKHFANLKQFIYIIGHKSKFKEIADQFIHIQNTNMGTNHYSVKGQLKEFLKISEDDDLNSITTLKSDASKAKIDFNEVSSRPFTIFMGSNSFMKHGSQRNIKNRIVILGTKDAQLNDAIGYLNNEYTTTEVFKENSKSIKGINKNFPAMFFQ
jgi:hypothetical protein